MDEQSFESTINSGAVRVQASIGKPQTEPNKIAEQLADLFSDALIIRSGDYIFPWLIKAKSRRAFQARCLADGRALFQVAAAMPVVVPLKPLQDRFEGLLEAEALDLWTPRLLWNAIGKKSLGRGRGITHQTPLEDDELLSRLQASGNAATVKAPVKKAIGIPLTIRTDPTSSLSFQDLQGYDPAQRLSEADPSKLTWAEDGRFKVEKALEAWIAENFDTPKGDSLRHALLSNGEVIRWAGNYLPFGVAGASMDFVLLTEAPDGSERYHIIELKRDSLAPADFTAAAVQVRQYAAYFERFVQSWTHAAPVTVHAHIISLARANVPVEAGVKHTLYAIKPNGTVTFSPAS